MGFSPIFVRYLEQKAHIFLDLVQNWLNKFSKVFIKNATHDEEFFCWFSEIKIGIICKLDALMQKLMKNHDFRHPTQVC